MTICFLRLFVTMNLSIVFYLGVTFWGIVNNVAAGVLQNNIIRII